MKLYPYQDTFLNNIFTRESKYHFLLAARQVGKTTVSSIAVIHVLAHLMADRSPYDKHSSSRMRQLKRYAQSHSSSINVNYFMPIAEQCKSTAMEVLEGYLMEFEKDFCQEGQAFYGLRINKTIWDNRITIEHDNRIGRIKFMGLDIKHQAKRGNTSYFAVCDEIANLDDINLKTVVEPMLSATGGPLCFCGTANTTVAMKRTYKRMHALTKRKKCTEMVVTIRDALDQGIIGRKNFDEVLESFGNDPQDPSYLMEYMCRMDLTPADSVFGHWHRTRLPATGSVADYEYYVSMDIGFTSMYVVMVWLRERATGCMILEAILSYNRILTEDICKDINERFPGIQFIVYMPHDSTRRSGVTPLTERQIWQESGICNRVLAVPTMAQHSRMTVAESVNMTRRHLQQMHLSDAIDLSDENFTRLMEYHFDPEKDEPVKDNVSDHFGDAFRYGVTSFVMFNILGKIDEKVEIDTDYMRRGMVKMLAHGREVQAEVKLREEQSKVKFRNLCPIPESQ